MARRYHDASYGVRTPKRERGGAPRDRPHIGAKDIGESTSTSKAGMRRQARGLAKRLADLPFP